MTAPTSTLLVGVSQALVQNLVYCAPARAVKFIATALVQQSIDNVTYTDVTASTTGMDLIAGYIKCTGVTTCVAVCKAV